MSEEPRGPEDERLKDFHKARILKVRQAIDAICDWHGKYLKRPARLSIDNDLSSDLIVRLTFPNGLEMRLTCTLRGEPLCEILAPDDMKRGPEPVNLFRIPEEDISSVQNKIAELLRKWR